MKPKYWLLLGLATACAAESAACSSSFKSCNDSRTCAPMAGVGGLGEAGEEGSDAGAPDHSGGRAGAPDHSGGRAGGAVAGEGGDVTSDPSEAGAGGSAGGAVTCSEDIDLKADPKNCGSCGHDCLGGECDQGSCQPYEIVPPDEYIYDIAVAGPYIYWSGCNSQFTECHVKRRRTDGSDVVKTIAANEGNVYGLAPSATDLYWLSNGHIRICTLPDCGTGAKDLEKIPDFVLGAYIIFSESGQKLFWSAQPSSGHNGLGVFTLGSIAPTTVGLESAEPIALASDAKNVYWLDRSTFTGSVPNPDGILWRASVVDLVPKPLVVGSAGYGGSIAVGPGWIYFAGQFDSKGPEGVSGAVFRAPLPNGVGAGAPIKFADAGEAGGLLSDDQNLYWLDSKLGTIERCPLERCTSPEILAAVQNTWLADQDAKTLFLASGPGDNRSILGLAK